MSGIIWDISRQGPISFLVYSEPRKACTTLVEGCTKLAYFYPNETVKIY